MKKSRPFTFKLVTALIVLLGLAVPGFAQTTTTRTLLTAAITDASTTITVTSTTNMVGTDNASATSPAWGLYVDAEYMQIRTVVSSTQLNVLRGQGGTGADRHLSGAIVWAGPRGASGPFSNADGSPGQPAPGMCTRGTLLFAPMINVITGNIWDCILSPPVGSPTAANSTTAQWSAVNLNPTYNSSRPYKKLAVTATTYTALPADYIIGVNTNVATTITLPSLTGAIGKEYIVQQENTATISLTIATQNGWLINGATSIIVGQGTGVATPLTYMGISIYTDGANYFARRSSN